MNIIMENNGYHKSGANSTLYKIAMKGFPLSSHIFIWSSPVFCCDKILICNFNTFICFWQLFCYKTRNLYSHLPSHTWVYNPIGQLQTVSKISSSAFCILRHRCHRRIYLLALTLIYTVVRHLIHFHISVRTSFRLFRVPVNFFIRSVRFLTICDEIILQSTSEVSIWFLTIMFSILIIRVAWI